MVSYKARSWRQASLEAAVWTGTRISVRYKEGKDPRSFSSIADYLHWLEVHEECWANIAHVTLVTESIGLVEPRFGFFKIRGVKGATAQNNGTRLIVDVRRPKTLARAFNVAVESYSPDDGGPGGDGEPILPVVRSLHDNTLDRHLYLVKDTSA